jgi:hypothetical protein
MSGWTPPRCQVAAECRLHCGCHVFLVACPPTRYYPSGRAVACGQGCTPVQWWCECGWDPARHYPCPHLIAARNEADAA